MVLVVDKFRTSFKPWRLRKPASSEDHPLTRIARSSLPFGHENVLTLAGNSILSGRPMSSHNLHSTACIFAQFHIAVLPRRVVPPEILPGYTRMRPRGPYYRHFDRLHNCLHYIETSNFTQCDRQNDSTWPRERSGAGSRSDGPHGASVLLGQLVDHSFVVCLQFLSGDNDKATERCLLSVCFLNLQ